MVALVLFQRATGRELRNLALPGQACDKATRDALLDLQDAGKARPDGWARGRKLWCLTKAGHKEAAGFLPRGTKLSTVREQERAGYDEHALDVVATAGHLARAGHGSPLTLTTEVRHAVPGRPARYADLVLRDPGAKVPVLLVEVDRDNETVGQLVEKLASYTAWCELLAKGADKARAKAARHDGAAVHAHRHWRTVYPPTRHEGYPPVALVLTPGRKRDRPGTKPLTPEQKAAKAERDHQRLLRRLDAVEAGSAAYWSPRPYPFAGVSAGNYHQALPVVATTLQLLDAHGADALVWRRFGRAGWHTLTAALDNPDGDRLLAIERQAAAAARRARDQAEREASRPACTRCEAKLTDAEWDRARWGETVCASCQREESDRKRAQLAAEAAAVAAAQAARAKNTGSWWRRS
ncbi:hypothetical protein ACIG0C_30005 [Kitasatospora aureofaciens]|uniref:Uncharacterized protein n=1 Tax=Kitasatospora aureofaciens TaxID=1894 RepID=A0A1E7NE25_KITAU|nr:hypothetical protein [Kitasatospora aureofaciens]ARF83192.1 hypothetical protein B6264_30070 [Kitasatospora aureofaciens]OEV38966.1 hypothetical protein HS99_0017810 [Kitasatospora aureofaciens]GGU99139.1 hypothetical protein GCM10010502_61920 [Kitasatospora aureofaciens]